MDEICVFISWVLAFSYFVMCCFSKCVFVRVIKIGFGNCYTVLVIY